MHTKSGLAMLVGAGGLSRGMLPEHMRLERTEAST